MESVTGQVRRMKFTEKLFEYVRKTREDKEIKREREAFLSEMSAAKSEFDSIRQNLNLITDADAKEYCIYRLKAAELNFNRYIKLAKSIHLTSMFTEEIL